MSTAFKTHRYKVKNQLHNITIAVHYIHSRDVILADSQHYSLYTYSRFLHQLFFIMKFHFDLQHIPKFGSANNPKHYFKVHIVFTTLDDASKKLR